MRWPWQRKHADVPEELPAADPEAAERAKRDSQLDREQVEKNNAYINWLSKKMLDHSHENHFSEWMADSMRRKHP